MPRTRIVASVGPATAAEPRIAALLDAGVDVFRLNFSHGTHEEHGEAIVRIRRLAGTHPVAILQDLGGPKLRLSHPVRGEPGDVVPIELPPSVRPGDPVLLADGVMQLEVVDAGRARVVVGGDVPAHKGINLPSSRLDFPALTDKDREDLRFGVANGVDFVALSFVGRATDLDEARASGVPVIAKIERAEAVARQQEIVAAADGVMVARGDLGVEIPIEQVPIVQKEVIRLANRLGKPVITATQMLRSMVDSERPTRAEASDVANAVLDGTDAVMLSEETAVGRYPVEAVRVMSRILGAAETLLQPDPGGAAADVAQAMADAACVMASGVRAAAIVVLTRTGATARHVARRRPPIPLIALTPDVAVARRLALVWGVTAVTAPAAVLGPVPRDFQEPVLATGLVPRGARVVLAAAGPEDPEGRNLVQVAVL